MTGRFSRGLGGGLLLCAACLVAQWELASVAAAKPNLWDAARSPRAKRASQGLVAVERMLMRIEDAYPHPTMVRDLSLAALALAELSGGVQLGDYRLDYLMGRLLTSPAVGRYAEGVAVLEKALAMRPDFPQAAEALYCLGRALARTGQRDRAIRVLKRALNSEWDLDLRASIALELGWQWMQMGRLPKALSMFSQATEAAQDKYSVALSYYALAAALDRSGDMPGALRAAAVAAHIQVSGDLSGVVDVFDLPLVDLDPDREVHYLRALGAMARAAELDASDSAREQLTAAIHDWDAYLREAEPLADRWIGTARRHREACYQRLEQYRAQAGLAQDAALRGAR